MADFIRDAIEDNPFQNTIYKRVYDMYFDMYDSELPQDTIVKRLLDGPDRVSSGIVADLIEYKYQLSVKNFVNSLTAVPSFLVRNVPHAIMVYNSSLVKTQEEEITSKLRELSRVEQTEEVMKEQDALLVKMQKVAELRKKIAERLGRVL